jgi:hypothetical protein
VPPCRDGLNHSARSVLGGFILQNQDGSWYATFHQDRSPVVCTVRFCPWCGVELWGRPQKPVEEVPTVAHARNVRWS